MAQLGGVPDVLALPYGGGNTVAYARGLAESGAGGLRSLSVESACARDPGRRDPDRRSCPRPRRRRRGAPTSSPSRTSSSSRHGARSRARRASSEPSSAAGVAALLAGHVERGARVVCVITGHGLKDLQTAIEPAWPTVTADLDPDSVAEAAAP